MTTNKSDRNRDIRTALASYTEEWGPKDATLGKYKTQSISYSDIALDPEESKLDPDPDPNKETS